MAKLDAQRVKETKADIRAELLGNRFVKVVYSGRWILRSVILRRCS